MFARVESESRNLFFSFQARILEESIAYFRNGIMKGKGKQKPEPPTGTTRRNHLPEPSAGTTRRNHLAEPSPPAPPLVPLSFARPASLLPPPFLDRANIGGVDLSQRFIRPIATPMAIQNCFQSIPSSAEKMDDIFLSLPFPNTGNATAGNGGSGGGGGNGGGSGGAVGGGRHVLPHPHAPLVDSEEKKDGPPFENQVTPVFPQPIIVSTKNSEPAKRKDQSYTYPAVSMSSTTVASDRGGNKPDPIATDDEAADEKTKGVDSLPANLFNNSDILEAERRSSLLHMRKSILNLPSTMSSFLLNSNSRSMGSNRVSSDPGMRKPPLPIAGDDLLFKEKKSEPNGDRNEVMQKHLPLTKRNRFLYH